MPVKIRCRGCEKILNAPDKARGRVIKCPHCQTKLKVPGGEAAEQKKTKPARQSASAGQPRRKTVKAAAKTARPPGSDSDFFANLDLEQAEDQQARICPFCAANLEEESDVCPECGMNVATRQMDARMAKQRSRKGPPSSAFYQGAWGDAVKFVKENKSLALRTGWYWGLFSILFGFSGYMAAVYCRTGPPIFFWSCLTLIFFLGIPGWYWFLSEKIIRAMLMKQEAYDRIQFDFFQCVTLGFRVFFWPAIVTLPITVLMIPLGISAVLTGNSATLILFQVLWLFQFAFQLLVFPLAMVHQTAKYTYKSWIFWEMLKVLVKNVGPSLYWGVMTLVVFLLPLGAVAGLIALMLWGATSPEEIGLLKMNQNVVAWMFGLIGESTESGLFSATVGLVHFLVGCILVTPIFLFMGFSILFLIRANGLLGITFQRQLMLVQRMPQNVPATFWVRTLAFIVDAPLTMLTGFLVTANKKALIFANLMNGALASGVFLWDLPLIVLLPLWLFVQMYVYFVVSEQTTSRTTIGKDGFGLIVSKDNDKQMSFQDATIRYFCGLANIATLGIGFVMCAFHPEKKALNDLLSKTKVVWQGDR